MVSFSWKGTFSSTNSASGGTHPIWVGPLRIGTTLVATDGQGFSSSTDGGSTWTGRVGQFDGSASVLSAMGNRPIAPGGRLFIGDAAVPTTVTAETPNLPPGNTFGGAAASAVRANGEVIVLGFGRTSVMGNAYDAVYYQRRTGPNTYTTPVQVSPNDANNYTDFWVVTVGDRAHIFYTAVPTGDSNYYVYMRTLSAANVLSPQVTLGSGSWLLTPEPARYLVAPGGYNASTGEFYYTMRTEIHSFVSADSPTVFNNEVVYNTSDSGGLTMRWGYVVVDSAGNPHGVLQGYRGTASGSGFWYVNKVDGAWTPGTAALLLAGDSGGTSSSETLQGVAAFTVGTGKVLGVEAASGVTGGIRYGEVVLEQPLTLLTGTGGLAAEGAALTGGADYSPATVRGLVPTSNSNGLGDSSNNELPKDRGPRVRGGYWVTQLGSSLCYSSDQGNTWTEGTFIGTAQANFTYTLREFGATGVAYTSGNSQGGNPVWFNYATGSPPTTVTTEVALSGDTTTYQATGLGVHDVAIRSADQVLVCQAPPVTIMGATYAAIGYRRRTAANTYTATTPISAGDAVNYAGCLTVTVGDRVHLFFGRSDQDWIMIRTLSATNVLSSGTTGFAASAYGGDGLYAISAPVAAGSTVYFGTYATGTNGGLGVMSFTSTDAAPTLTFENFLHPESGSTVPAIAYDSVSGDVYAVYRLPTTTTGSTGDYVYRKKPSGGTWGPERLFLAQTQIADNKGNLYPNGAAILTKSDGSRVLATTMMFTPVGRPLGTYYLDVEVATPARFRGTGTLSATGRSVVLGTAAFTGDSELIPLRGLSYAANATATGAGDLTSALVAVGFVAQVGPAGIGHLTARATRTGLTGAAAPASAGSLSATQRPTPAGRATTATTARNGFW